MSTQTHTTRPHGPRRLARERANPPWAMRLLLCYPLHNVCGWHRRIIYAMITLAVLIFLVAGLIYLIADSLEKVGP